MLISEGRSGGLVCRQSCDSPVTLSLLSMRPGATEKHPWQGQGRPQSGLPLEALDGFPAELGAQDLAEAVLTERGQETGSLFRAGLLLS